MKSIFTGLLSIFFLSAIIGQHSGCEGNRFLKPIYKDIKVTKDVKYGHNTTVGGNEMDLKMDIYEPKGDELDKRPLIVMVHGGGYVGGDRSNMRNHCMDLAKYGYVTASISYRLIDVENYLPELATGTLMAIHDLKAAIRFFREDAATSNAYRIDPNFIVAGGSSAGAITANFVAYMDTLDQIPPPVQLLIDQNGGIEGNSSNNLEYSSKVQAVLNYCGGIMSTEFMDAGEPPLYSFHDEYDGTVPCGYNPSVGVLKGSCEMHERAEEVGIKNRFYFKADSRAHCGYYYGPLIYESAQFLAEVLCESTVESPWEKMSAGLDHPGSYVGDIAAVNKDIIWTIPMFGRSFSRTTDGGVSWNTGNITESNPTYKVVGVEAIDASTAWTMMLSWPDQKSGKIYKTTDGGLKWEEQSSSFTGLNEGPQAFRFFNENDGFALAEVFNEDPAKKTHVGYVTSDGGANWKKLGPEVYPAEKGENIRISTSNYFDIRGDHIWWGTGNGYVYHSADKGNHWEKTMVFPFISISSVAFKDEMNGIVVGDNANFGNLAYSTSDGGKTWKRLSITQSPRGRTIYYVEGSDNDGACGTYMLFFGQGSSCGMAYSKDDGKSWTLASEQPAFVMDFIDADTGFMGGMIYNSEEGGLYKWVGESLKGAVDCNE